MRKPSRPTAWIPEAFGDPCMLEQMGARSFALAHLLSRCGERAGVIAQLLGLASHYFRSAQLLREVAEVQVGRNHIFSHSGDASPDPITARAVEKGGGAVSPSDTS